MITRFRFLSFFVLLVSLCSLDAFALISVGNLAKDAAKEKYGITMHARSNGEAGILVWIKFKKKGILDNLTYAELHMTGSDGKHRISARLEPHPVVTQQPIDVVSLAFSASKDELKNCSFFLVCYGSEEGDIGYFLPVKDFLDLENPVTEK